MSRIVDEFQCLIISPSDVDDERRAAVEVIEQWNASNRWTTRKRLEPARWETHSYPIMGSTGQGAVNDQIVDHVDLGIAIFWSRLGTPTTDHPSGSIEEIALLLARGRPVMVYRSTKPLTKKQKADAQYKSLKEQLKRLRTQGLVWDFTDAADLKTKLTSQLPQLVGRLVRSPLDELSSSTIAELLSVRVHEKPKKEQQAEERRLEELTIHLWGSLLFEMRFNCERVRFMIDLANMNQVGFAPFDFALSDALIAEFSSLVPQPAMLVELNSINAAVRRVDFFQRRAGEDYMRAVAFARDAAKKKLFERFNALLSLASDFGRTQIADWDSKRTTILPSPIDPSAPIDHQMI